MPPTAKVATAYVDLQMQTAAFKAALGEATSETRKFAASMRAEMAEAKGSIALIGEEVGVVMPRHLRTFVAQLPGVATAMSAAFNAVAIIALADFVYKAGEKVVEFFRKSEEAAHKNAGAAAQFTDSLVKSNAQLGVGNDKLEIEIAKLSRKPTNNLKLALDEAKLSAIELADKLEKATTKERELLDSQNAGWFARLTGTASNDSVKAGLEEYDKNYQKVNQQFNEYVQAAKSVGEQQNLEIQRRQALAGLTNHYYDELSKEIKLRKEYQAVRDSGGDLNTDEARQFEYKYGGGDQSKVLPSLQNLQGQIGVGATGLSLEVHHDQLVNQDAALQAKKEATEASSKADQERLRQLETSFKQQKDLFGMSSAAEADFWHSKLGVFHQKTAEYISVLDKYDAAMRERYRVEDAADKKAEADVHRGMHERAAAQKLQIDQNEDSTHTGERWKSFNDERAKGREIQAASAASLALMRVQIGLSTGALSPHQAALAQEAAHVEDYRRKFEALNDLLGKTQADTSLTPAQKDTQTQGLRNQIDDTRGKAQIQALTDAQATLSTTWTGMVDGVFDELIRKSQDTQTQLKFIATSTIDGLNSEMAKSITGQKTDYSKIFLRASESLAKSGLEKAEGFGLQALGLGKRDGSSAANALFVQMIGELGGATGDLIPDNISRLFSSPKSGLIPLSLSSAFAPSKPNVVGLGGGADSAMASAMGKGMRGWLNDSDWASSLMGGRLFGSGSIFGHFASGGDVPAGVPVRVGEMGQEDAIFPTGARIIPHNQAAGGVTYHIDARGTDPALTQANVARALQATRVQAVHDASRAMMEHGRRVPN